MKSIRYLKIPFVILLFLGLTAYEPAPGLNNEVNAGDAFIWHDLVTPDLDKSMTFYTAVFGWTFKAIKVKGLRLAAIYAGSERIGGAIEVPGANTAVWVKAIVVDDLDRGIGLVERNGGRVILPPAAIPGRGTQVIMEGPEGEEFSFIGNVDPSFSRVTLMEDTHLAWSELWADTPENSKNFYEAVFNVVTQESDVDDRPYWVFQSGARKVAGMIQNPVTNQGTQWIPYVLTSDPSGVVENARSGGAFIVLEPAPEVRDGKVGIFQDPLGALVCVQQK